MQKHNIYLFKNIKLIYAKITILFTFILFNTIHIMYNLVLSIDNFF